MDPLVLWPLVVVAAILLVAGLVALRHPVLLRMASRNALRRRWQSVVVVGGLMVGTAIIAGSLAAGDSLSFGIRQGAYDALGPADVFLQTDGNLHYSTALLDDIRANATAMRDVKALTPLLYEEAALSAPRTHQSEPRVALIGIDPATQKPFGALHPVGGGTLDPASLGPTDIILRDDVAQKLDVKAGDTVSLHYAPAPVPRIPRLYLFGGNVTAGAGACPLPGTPACAFVAPPTDQTTFAVPVEPGAVGLTTLVAWQGSADLDQLVKAPDGTTYANTNGTPAAPDDPSVLNVTGKLAPGNWTLQVGAKVAANQPFRAVALVFYEEYNLSAIQQFAKQAEAAGFDTGAFTGGFETQGETANFTVKAVVTKEGFGGFLLGQNAFARIDAVGKLYGVEGKTNLALASADLDPVKGPDKTAALMGALPKAVNASAAQHPDERALAHVNAVPIKQKFLDAADRAGTLFKEFLTSIGSFTVIAGVMLIVNIFVMLAEERKSELGMARAVGLSRRQLIYLFGFEGVLYALAATAIGVLLGLGLAYGLIWGFNGILADPTQGPSFTIPFHAEGSSLLLSGAAGFAITFVTVAVASWRVSRLNVVRAIRHVEEPAKKPGRAMLLVALALLVLGGAWGAYGWIVGDFPGKILGPCMALLGSGFLLARVVRPRLAYPLAGAAVAAYCMWSIFTFGNPKGLLNAAMGPIRGLFIVLAVVLILIYIPQLVTFARGLLMRVRRWVPAVAPGVAYPLEKKTRTGLTVTMFALVMLVVVAFSIFGATFTIDLKAQSGGYDVEGDTTVPLATDLHAYALANKGPGLPDPFLRVARYDALRYAVVYGGSLLKINGQTPSYQGAPVDYVYTYDASFAQNNRYGFESLDPRYHSDREAYEAVLKDPTLAIVSVQYNVDDQGNPGLHKVGDTLTMETPSGPVAFRIIGFQKQLYLGGVFVNPDVLAANFPNVRGDYLFQLKPGEDPAVAARELEAAFEKAGMDAQSIQALAQKQAQQTKQFLTLFQLFLGFGLVVGVASLGIVTARSVLERRQEIGMLRAVGYGPRDILRMLYIEIYLTTTLGVLVGGAIGIFTSYGVVASTPGLDALGVTFRIPWLDLAEILLLVYVAVFLATVAPARRGSKVPPAEAVRYLE
ncbi:MAG: putative transport system permease protein [Thermoplasmata archaeon]|jgi:putative ABC transport system permease protein|nr:putative transport system permease protein [Thermoplasmata archaeon]